MKYQRLFHLAPVTWEHILGQFQRALNLCDDFGQVAVVDQMIDLNEISLETIPHKLLGNWNSPALSRAKNSQSLCEMEEIPSILIFDHNKNVLVHKKNMNRRKKRQFCKVIYRSSFILPWS
jgi:hypothetical protein